MFLHTNLSPKWNLRVPGSSADLARRWEVLQPGGRPFREALSFEDGAAFSSSSSSSSSNSSPFGSTVDLEGEVFDYLAALSCDRALQRYASAMAARANALRELEEERERREDEELERLLEAEAASLGREKKKKKKEKKEKGKQGRKGQEQEKPLWRVQAEERRAARLEEEKRRESELRRRRQKRAAALAAKSASGSSKRLGEEKEGGQEEEEGREGEEGREQRIEDLGEGDPSLLLLEARGRPPRPCVAAADLLPRGLPPDSFHPLNPGVDFAAAFRWGLRGTFEEFAPPTSFDRLLHFVNGGVRPAGRWLGRAAAFVARGGRGYFRPF